MPKKITIGIAEDHNMLRTALVGMLDDIEDFEVIVEAVNGQDLIDQLEFKQPHILLVDIEMPIMDGPTAVAQIRKKYKNKLCILGLSMHKEIKLINEMLIAGSNGFIPKEAQAEELIEAIHQVLEVEFYVSPVISSQLYKSTEGLLLFDYEPLSEMETTLLKLICMEKNNAEIADELCFSRNTINTYRTRLIEKLNVKNTAGLVVYAIQQGIYRY